MKKSAERSDALQSTSSVKRRIDPTTKNTVQYLGGLVHSAHLFGIMKI